MVLSVSALYRAMTFSSLPKATLYIRKSMVFKKASLYFSNNMSA